MLDKTKGIVLNQIKYSDSSIIITLYTDNFGKQSYMVKNAHVKKSKIKSNLFGPLNILELEVSNRKNRELQIITEARIHVAFSSIPYNIVKSSLALFISEILYRSLREEISNPELFEFLEQNLILLDNETGALQNFHFYLLMQLSKHLGFFPINNYSESHPYFDLLEGHFSPVLPQHPYAIDKEISKTFSLLPEMNYEESKNLVLSRQQRNELLQKLILYYQLHLISFPEVKSFEVLKEVLG